MMLTPFLWLAASGPLLLLLAGVVPAAAGPASRLAIAAAGASLLTAIATAVSVASAGTLRTPTLGANGIGASLYLDPLSAAMFCLVSFVGLIVVLYSRNYMDGDPRHAGFTRSLCLTLASVLTAIVAGNLVLFAVAWIATSLCLQQLLLFYPERPAAVLAGRKKFLTSRLGDLCIIISMVLLYGAFGSFDYTAIFAGADAMRGGSLGLPIHAVALLLVVAALLTSAQFPTHGWLIEVMETPTPVSALLHAGIINAGGFLVLRFSNLVSLSAPSLDTLILIGGFTAIFGSIVMLTQTSIKVTLAYSTVAQMGFMMLECGLGAFAAALLHIVAHSCYKAHAFLSSGSVIDIARASYTPTPVGKPHPGRLIFTIAAVLAVTGLVGRAFGASISENPGVFALGATLLLGVVHLLAKGFEKRPNLYVVARTVGLAIAVAIAYFGLQYGSERLMMGSFPRAPVSDWFGIAAVTIVILSFAVVVFLQNSVPRRAVAPRWQAMYAHFSNGLYVNTLANRFVVKFWPSPPPRPLSSGAPVPGATQAGGIAP